MANERPLALTLQLLDQEIAAVEERIHALKRERELFAKTIEEMQSSQRLLAFGREHEPSKNGVHPPGSAEVKALTAAQAIDSVLAAASSPMLVKDLVAAVGKLPTQGKPDDSALRSVLRRRHGAMGWEFTKRAGIVRWSKGKAPQEAE